MIGRCWTTFACGSRITGQRIGRCRRRDWGARLGCAGTTRDCLRFCDARVSIPALAVITICPPPASKEKAAPADFLNVPANVPSSLRLCRAPARHHGLQPRRTVPFTPAILRVVRRRRGAHGAQLNRPTRERERTG